MSDQRIGYIRVSSTDQNPDRQLADQRDTLDKVFIDYASGKDTNRPEWQALLQYVRDGDTIVVHSIDRLARNLEDLRSIVRHCTARGITVAFAKEQLQFHPASDAHPMDQFLFDVMGAFAEFERALIRERQKEGIALAKARGVYKGGHIKLGAAQESEIQQLLAAGRSKSAVARHFGVHRATIYRHLAGQSTGKATP